LIRKIVILLFAALITFNCSDAPTSIGVNLLANDLIKVINTDSVQDTLTQYSSSFYKEISLGSSNRLLLGKKDNLEASVLIRFFVSLSDSLKQDIIDNNIEVTNAVMKLNQNYSFGDESEAFDFTVHSITSDWGTNFTKDSLNKLSYEGEDFSLAKEINDSITSVTLNNQLIQSWLSGAADTSLNNNKGIYLKPIASTNKILGYQAFNINDLTNIPIIEVVIEKPGVYTDTVALLALFDVGVVDGTPPPVSAGNLTIESGYIFNSRLTFDISKIPSSAIINEAELVLTLDTIETMTGSSYTNSIYALYLIDSTNTDSLPSFFSSLARSGSQFTGNVTSIVRLWRSEGNNGLLLIAPGQLDGLELFAIKGSNVPDAYERPLLKLTYTNKE
jgi:hypothetical protein